MTYKIGFDKPGRHVAQCILTLGLASAANAQSTLYSVEGTSGNDRLGHDMASAGDFNGDGTLDFIVGAPQNGAIFGGGAGYARVFSGVDASTLATLVGNAGVEAFGNSVAGVGDIDGDGFDDVAVGAPFQDGAGLQRGRVVVFSGQTQAVLNTFNGAVNGVQMGWTVAGVGDVNNDGVPDIAGCSFSSDVVALNSGTVTVWSGLSGGVLHTWEGANPNAHYGVAIVSAGDFDSDGFDDILVGGWIGPVEIRSGQTGLVLQSFAPSGPDDAFGASAANLGDLTGDGYPEFLIGAPQNSAFGPSKGLVRVLNGATGATIDEFVGDLVRDEFGYSVASAGDYDGDGTLDYLIGAPATSDSNRDGYARVYSGSNGAVLKTFSAESGASRLGAKVANFGDLDSDGVIEIAVAEPEASTPGLRSGEVEVVTGAQLVCPSPTKYCVALPNTTGMAAEISSSGSNSHAANSLVLTATQCPPGNIGLFFYGRQQAFALFGSGVRCVGGGLYRLQPTLVIDASGSASHAVDLQNLPAVNGQILAGETWNFQFWFRDPGDGNAETNLTDGLEVVFCP